MASFKATPDQWDRIRRWGRDMGSCRDACILELLSRIEVLEANTSALLPEDEDSAEGGSLVTRVARAIGRDDEPINWEPEARAAIREVLAWLKEGEHIWTALKLEQEVQ
jgi:hypothetical protein